MKAKVILFGFCLFFVTSTTTGQQLPTLRPPIESTAAVPDGGVFIRSRRMGNGNSISGPNVSIEWQHPPGTSLLEALANESGFSGKHRDIWGSKDSNSGTGAFALGRNSVFYSLFSRSILEKELELTDHQVKELRILTKECRAEITLLEARKKNGSPTEIEMLLTKAEAVADRFDNQVEKILLPHQLDFLKQFLFRFSIQRTGFFSSMTKGRLSKELNLTEKQKEQFAFEAKKVLDEHEKLLKTSLSKILVHLDQDQLNFLHENLGTDFERDLFSNSSRLIVELKKLSSTITKQN